MQFVLVRLSDTCRKGQLKKKGFLRYILDGTLWWVYHDLRSDSANRYDTVLTLVAHSV